MRHRKDDNCKSRCYSSLVEAENYAIENRIGIHSDDINTEALKCIDMTYSPNLVKPIIPKLQQINKIEVIIESVLTSVRFRIYVKKLNVVISLILAGLHSPKSQTNHPSNSQLNNGTNVSNSPSTISKKSNEPDESFAESLQFSRNLCLHHTAIITYDFMDRGGNIIGNMEIDGKDIACEIVSQGHATINWDLLGDMTDEKRIRELKKAEFIANTKRAKVIFLVRLFFWCTCCQL